MPYSVEYIIVLIYSYSKINVKCSAFRICTLLLRTQQVVTVVLQNQCEQKVLLRGAEIAREVTVRIGVLPSVPRPSRREHLALSGPTVSNRRLLAYTSTSIGI